MPWYYVFRQGNLSWILRWNKIGLRKRRRRRIRKKKKKIVEFSYIVCSRWHLTRFTGKCNVSCLTSCLFLSYRCTLAKRNIIELKCFLCLVVPVVHNGFLPRVAWTRREISSKQMEIIFAITFRLFFFSLIFCFSSFIDFKFSLFFHLSLRFVTRIHNSWIFGFCFFLFFYF